MGALNLIVHDPFSKAVSNPEFFYPLTLKLDPAERANFQRYFDEHFAKDVGGEALYSPMPDAKSMFPKTAEATNKFLEPLGIMIRSMTVFTSGANSVGRNIHVDGTKLADNKTEVVLEARLSYYEMATTPGVIRWFPKTQDYIKEVIDNGKKYGVHWVLPWIKDLQSDKLSWETCPDYEFATSSNAPSAILRTNRPHHVTQGPGTRLTISAQLVFIKDRNPVGVWDHIEKNFHLLGI